MDILAHTLWANAGARGANEIADKKGKKDFKISPAWAGFWGVVPDFFAFTFPFLFLLYKMLIGQASFGFPGHHLADHSGFDLASYLYQFSHSIIIFALVFTLVWVWRRRPCYEMLGWLLHILIDIPSHSLSFYPTPFLFPISDYRFPYGVSWANQTYMIINYSLLLLIWGHFLYRKKLKK